MKCPFCSHAEDRVVDSRSVHDGSAVRRRRECLGCGRRYTTYEYVEDADVVVVKKDGRREPYDREKVHRSISRACGKRPIGPRQTDEIVERVEAGLLALQGREIPTSLIGELVMEELRQADQVAYVRFASVYREFKDSEQFLKELNRLLGSR
ncbi:MAG: transcriptional regulator NrdR [Candidatus Eisenbacteria bacterium]|jgi:transcriptional repressor NrdR|nr:transcriptional regulator NrdR [Candidatus Eisenbacteria bacterium]